MLTVTVASYLISGVLHRTSHHGPLSTSGHTCQAGSSSSSPSPSPRRKRRTQRSPTRDEVSNVPTVTTRGEGSATDIQQVESTDAATRPTARGAPDDEARRPAPRPAQAAGLGRERGTPAADGSAWYRANPLPAPPPLPLVARTGTVFFFSNFLCKNCKSMFLDGGIGDSYSR